jgi:hypothetical protein
MRRRAYLTTISSGAEPAPARGDNHLISLTTNPMRHESDATVEGDSRSRNYQERKGRAIYNITEMHTGSRFHHNPCEMKHHIHPFDCQRSLCVCVHLYAIQRPSQRYRPLAPFPSFICLITSLLSRSLPTHTYIYFSLLIFSSHFLPQTSGMF